ncbi:MAG: thioredoxin fold domain-containing protein [Bacteroidia bacterium]
MVKKVLIAIAILGVYFTQAQNKQIIFEAGNFSSVLSKAAKNNKLIFIDAFTTWCGPCKKMAKEIFTNDTVANYFNKTFINYKFDMEKGEGIDFAKKYQVNCYPNLVILDSKGNLVHRAAGYMKAKEFIEFAQAAQSKDKNFYALKNNFEKAGITEKTIGDYINLLDGACLDASGGVIQYLSSVKEEDLINKTNWELLRDHVTDINSREIKYLITNHKEFELRYHKEVENKISKLGSLYFSDYLKAKEFDRSAFEKSKAEFLKTNWPYSDKIVFDTELKLNKRHNKPAFYAMAVQPEFFNYNVDNASVLNSMAWIFYEDVTDKIQLESAVKMAKRACELADKNDGRYMYIDTYASLLYKTENYKEAEIQAHKAIEAANNEKISEEGYKETTELLKKIKAKIKS